MKRIIAMLVVLFGSIVLALPQPSTAQTTTPDPGFSMIVASDPQLHWWREKLDDSCKDDDCVKRKGEESNRHLVSAMNSITSLNKWPATSLTFGAESSVATPRGVIINGDLTEYWHKAQKEKYEEIYGALNYQKYEGLGNHDYDNNVDDCEYQGIYHPDKNRCAKEAVWWMANTIHGLPNVVNKDVPGMVAVYNGGGYVARFSVTYTLAGSRPTQSSGNFEAAQWRAIPIPVGATNVSVKVEEYTLTVSEPWKTIINTNVSATTRNCYRVFGTTLDPKSESYGCPHEWPNGSAGSLSYAFDIEDYHFVQLHNYPGYTRDLARVSPTIEEGLTFGVKQSPSFSVTDGTDWLRADLSAATAAGKKIVINLHDYDAGESSLTQAVRDQNVVAIFAGHRHEQYGQMSTLANGSYQIPVFYSGSAECKTFLLADFHARWFNVGVINAEGGYPAFMTTPEVCDTSISSYMYNDATTSLGTYIINHPPTNVTGTLETTPAQEGTALTFRADATDPDGDPLTYEWTFGDGRTATGQTVNHTYADNRINNNQTCCTVQLTVRDHPFANNSYSTSTSISFPVTVNNVAPQVTATGMTIDENGFATVTGTITDPGVRDTFYVHVEWGEGDPQRYGYPAGATSFSQRYQYRDDNPTGTPSDTYAIDVTVEDKDGGVGTAATQVIVNNVNPVAAIDTIRDQSGKVLGSNVDIVLEGLRVDVAGSVTDVGTRDTHVARIDWGDGTSTNLGATTGTIQTDHVYEAAGTYNVALTVTDDDTGAHTPTAQIPVVTAAGALENTIQKLTMMAADPALSAAARTETQKALAKLTGNGGALALLRTNQRTAAVQLINLAIQDLQNAEKADRSLNLTASKALLTLTAKSVAVKLIQATTAVATTKLQRDAIAQARGLVSKGDLQLSQFNYVGAATSYWEAVRLVEPICLAKGCS